MTSPETLELEAIDAALAGRYVAPEHADLAELALLLRDDRPEPTIAWAAHLDRRVSARFPARPRKRRFSFLYTQAATVIAVLVLLAVPIGLALTLGGGSDGDSGSEMIGAKSRPSVNEDSGGAQGSASSEAAPAAGRAPLATQARRPRSVERAAELTLAAPRRDIDKVATEIGDVTADLGGFVARSSVTSS